MDVDLYDAMDILESLLIERLPNDRLDAINENIAGYYGAQSERYFTTVLAALGYGDYDYEKDIFTPKSRMVYAFDTEVFNITDMYSNFLKGISAISLGEYEIANVNEEITDWDEESGINMHAVSFEFNGEEYSYNIETEGDWFNFDMLENMIKLIEKADTGKKLYVTGDGGQSLVIMYNTPKWAEVFEEKTGLELDDSMF